MPLDLVFRDFTRQRAYGPRFFTRVLTVALTCLKLRRRTVEVSVALIGPRRMHALNKRYRSVDAPTDVLSFPIGAAPRGGLVGCGARRYTLDALGDIFICPALAREQALRHGVPIGTMFAWLTIHGFLHLIGYDHKQSGARQNAMFALEKKILNALRHGSIPSHLRN